MERREAPGCIARQDARERADATHPWRTLRGPPRAVPSRRARPGDVGVRRLPALYRDARGGTTFFLRLSRRCRLAEDLQRSWANQPICSWYVLSRSASTGVAARPKLL